MTNRLIVVFGLPWSGKKTVAKKIYEILGKDSCKVLRTDEIRKELFPRPIYSQAEAEETFAEMHVRADKVLSSGKTAVLVGVFAKKFEREKLLRTAQKNKTECVFLNVFVSEDIIHTRLPEHASSPEEVDYDVYLKLKSYFDPIEWPVRYIDNSKDLANLHGWVESILK